MDVLFDDWIIIVRKSRVKRSSLLLGRVCVSSCDTYRNLPLSANVNMRHWSCRCLRRMIIHQHWMWRLELRWWNWKFVYEDIARELLAASLRLTHDDIVAGSECAWFIVGIWARKWKHKSISDRFHNTKRNIIELLSSTAQYKSLDLTPNCCVVSSYTKKNDTTQQTALVVA